MITVDKIYKHMKTFLYCREVNRTLLELTLATILGRRLSDCYGLENIWLIIIGGPSSGKSLTLAPCSSDVLQKGGYIYKVDDLSEAAIVSGYRDEENEKDGTKKNYSLSKDWDHKTVVFRDLTRMIQKGQVAQSVFDQLRIFYDGSYTAGYGNNIHEEIVSRFNFLGASTAVMDRCSEDNISMGERYLYYRVPALKPEEKRAITKISASTMTKSKGCNAQLEDMCSRFIMERWDAYQKDSFKVPRVRDEVMEQLIDFALFTTEMRVQPTKNERGDVVAQAEEEGPMRVAKQLASLSISLAALEGKEEVGPKELEVVKHVAISSLPEIRSKLLSLAWWQHLHQDEMDDHAREKMGLSPGFLANELRMTETNARRLLENTYISGLLEQSVHSKGKGGRLWVISKKAIKSIESSKLEAEMMPEYVFNRV